MSHNIQPEALFMTDEQEIIEKFKELLGRRSPFKKSLFVYHEDDGSVSYKGTVDFCGKNLTHLPFKFRKVGGWFNISYNNLKTLIGCPEEAGGNFYCNHNNLVTLDGGPTIVGCPEEAGGSFYCNHNNLVTLDGGPTIVGGRYYCSNNNLTTLHGCPEEIGGDFWCYSNNLVTLDGGPKVVGGGYYCNDNPLQNFTGFPRKYKGICFTPDNLYHTELPWLNRRAGCIEKTEYGTLIYRPKENI